jgi:succinyl-CoA synthetase alpha subunit
VAILVDENTKVICQGFTGSQGTFHSEQAIAYGTKMVGGVTPGKGGATHLGLPVFDSVHEAVADRRQRHRDLRAPALRRRLDPRGDRRRDPADRLHHRRHPGARHDAVKRALMELEVAPHRPELPRRDDARRMQDRHHAGLDLLRGSVGVVSRSGTLTYEAVKQTTDVGLGQSTAVGIGGDPIKGTEHIDVLEMFLADPETQSIIMIGEIGGAAEEDAAQFLRTRRSAAAGSPPPASSPAAPPPRAAAWAMPAPSSRAARATRNRRSRR